MAVWNLDAPEMLIRYSSTLAPENAQKQGKWLFVNTLRVVRIFVPSRNSGHGTRPPFPQEIIENKRTARMQAVERDGAGYGGDNRNFRS
jgi:hypothetical protein